MLFFVFFLFTANVTLKIVLFFINVEYKDELKNMNKNFFDFQYLVFVPFA